MVLGILCSCLIPIYLSNPFEDSGLDLAVPFFVILICAPRLFYDKIWASLLLMTCAILTTLWLLYFTGVAVLQTIANLDVFDGFIFSFLIIVTVIALLSCYLCYCLFKLLFKTNIMKKSTKRICLIILIAVLALIECLLCHGIALERNYLVDLPLDHPAIKVIYRDVMILEIFMFINLGIAVVSLILLWRKPRKNVV